MNDDDEWDDWDDHEPVDPFPFPLGIEVTEADNPIVATIFGADGEPLVDIHERPQVPFGFQPNP